MTKYVIKVTYLEGNNKGKYYYLDKQGYVIENLKSVWNYQAYTEKGCKTACTRFAKDNAIENAIEKRERESRVSKGKTISPYMLYWLCSYEPLAVEIIGE